MAQFGLIGKNLSHSFSKKYFTNKFEKENLNHVYEGYPLDHIKDFEQLCTANQFSGLNVTIPYKKLIIPFLDEVDATAKEVGAVNTILFKNGKRIGYNTDILGFRLSIGPFLEDYHSKALILGTGGAANAVAYVLEKLEMQCLFVSRNPSKIDEIGYSDINLGVMQEYLVVINTTPVGTFPNIDQSPHEFSDLLTQDHFVYDLIYNPPKTKLLQIASQQGAQIKNGLEMLEIQAEESWKIWNS